MKLAAIVGMAGAGKSEVAAVFEESGFARIRFGDITDEELRRRGMDINEPNEQYIRELLRQERGMAAYALLNLPRIENLLKNSNVVIDGLYSWEEYTLLKDKHGDSFYVIAVCCCPRLRYARLTSRSTRNLGVEDAMRRDRTEIENVNKGGPIAMADFSIINQSSIENLRTEVGRIIAKLNGHPA